MGVVLTSVYYGYFDGDLMNLDGLICIVMSILKGIL